MKPSTILFEKCAELTKTQKTITINGITIREIETPTHYNNRGRFFIETQKGVFDLQRFPAIVSDSLNKNYLTLQPLDSEDYENAAILNRDFLNQMREIKLIP